MSGVSFCPQCGTQRTGDFRYCGGCGLDLADLSTPATAGDADRAQEPPRTPTATPRPAHPGRHRGRRPGRPGHIPNGGSVRPVGGHPPPVCNDEDAATLGTLDGEAAGQAIAGILLAAYRPGLFSALDLASWGMSGPAASPVLAHFIREAHGGLEPWRADSSSVPGEGDPSTLKSVLLQAFRTSLGESLRSSTTISDAIRPIVSHLGQGAGLPPREPWSRWVGALVRLSTAKRESEARLQSERAADLQRGRPPAWLLPAPRSMGWMERRTMAREFPSLVLGQRPPVVGTVSDARTGRDVFRASFPSADLAAQTCADVASTRWQISRLPHLSKLDEVLDHRCLFVGPFGIDVIADMADTADRSDRVDRFRGPNPTVGQFSPMPDSFALDSVWAQIEAGDVDGLLSRFKTPPFGLVAS